ncbi:uncharacterized protein LOC122510047 [Leptopilina heterotoma]|uniref:uncharacterized protein LOC122510047 n=1 Tax=Leptopilina heterotoma TaxID=63436 RepID=UPI001CA8FB1A|nr:uncharacterized protein LOC122510047 [Leptopilina heterotoma]
MWNYLMPKEPSIFRLSKCLCGNEKTEEIPYLRVNHRNISECGFKVLQKSLLNEENCNEQCDNEDCDISSQSVELQYNSHIIIETDVRDMIDLRKSITCRVDDFPAHLILHGKSYRLSGIICYLPGHYFALCRRVDGNWEKHDDLNENVQPFHKGDYEKHYTPSAAVYIRDENQLGNSDEAAFSKNINYFEDYDAASSLKRVTLTDELKNKMDDIKHNESVYLEHPYSLLKEKDNWRNKLEKEDSLFNKTIKISPVAVTVKKASRKYKNKKKNK